MKYRIGDTVRWKDYTNYKVFESPLLPPEKTGIVTSLVHNTLDGKLAYYEVVLDGYWQLIPPEMLDKS